MKDELRHLLAPFSAEQLELFPSPKEAIAWAINPDDPQAQPLKRCSVIPPSRPDKPLALLAPEPDAVTPLAATGAPNIVNLFDALVALVVSGAGNYFCFFDPIPDNSSWYAREDTERALKSAYRTLFKNLTAEQQVEAQCLYHLEAATASGQGKTYFQRWLLNRNNRERLLPAELQSSPHAALVTDFNGAQVDAFTDFDRQFPRDAPAYASLGMRILARGLFNSTSTDLVAQLRAVGADASRICAGSQVLSHSFSIVCWLARLSHAATGTSGETWRASKELKLEAIQRARDGRLPSEDDPWGLFHFGWDEIGLVKEQDRQIGKGMVTAFRTLSAGSRTSIGAKHRMLPVFLLTGTAPINYLNLTEGQKLLIPLGPLDPASSLQLLQTGLSANLLTHPFLKTPLFKDLLYGLGGNPRDIERIARELVCNEAPQLDEEAPGTLVGWLSGRVASSLPVKTRLAPQLQAVLLSAILCEPIDLDDENLMALMRGSGLISVVGEPQGKVHQVIVKFSTAQMAAAASVLSPPFSGLMPKWPDVDLQRGFTFERDTANTLMLRLFSLITCSDRGKLLIDKLLPGAKKGAATNSDADVDSFILPTHDEWRAMANDFIRTRRDAAEWYPPKRPQDGLHPSVPRGLHARLTVKNFPRFDFRMELHDAVILVQCKRTGTTIKSEAELAEHARTHQTTAAKDLVNQMHEHRQHIEAMFPGKRVLMVAMTNWQEQNWGKQLDKLQDMYVYDVSNIHHFSATAYRYNPALIEQPHADDD
eukprot:TRINITY_DN1600_c0_g1_i1.p1 TRINITY_DN1600_c0_g1~~TRINITY_DN1600_c0_g1_i1.p1  ORF type:complete len:764 (-),score=147.62 TRINITY_DN1600_c0_g1_i1:11-2302(-)